MADVIRYVNPLSSGGDGTTTATSGANAAYASMNAAQDALIQNITSLGAGSHVRIKCFGAAEDTVPLVFDPGWTSDADNQLIFENATGESGGDPDFSVFDTSAYRFHVTTTASGGVIKSTGDIRNLDYITFRNLQFKATLNGSANQIFLHLTASPWSGTVLLDGCVIYVGGSCTGGQLYFAELGTTVNLYLRNCLLVLTGYTGSAAVRGLAAENAGAVIRAHNCTFKDIPTALYQTSGTISAGNNIFQNCTTVSTGTVGSVGGNKTSTSSLGSMTTTTEDEVSRTFTFLGAGSFLDPTDEGAKDNAVDLSADANLPVTTDVVGTARPFNTVFDAGYYEVDETPITITCTVSSGVPGDTITFTLLGFTVKPDITINGVAVTSTGDETGGTFDIPGLAEFLAGGDHETTRWGVTINITATGTGADVGLSDNFSFTINAPDTNGPNQFFGTVTTPSGDTVFPATVAVGDDYFIERISGTINDILTSGSVSTAGEAEINVRIFDVSEGSWSAIEDVLLTISSRPPLGVYSIMGILGKMIGGI